MERRPRLLFVFLLTASVLFSQRDTTLAPLPEDVTAFLSVSCDSSGLDIFVDDILVGQSPIDKPIPINSPLARFSACSFLKSS